MRKTFVFAAAIILISTTVFGANGVIPGGGTEGDPYLIEDFLDFQSFCGNTSYWDDYTRLECDLDLTPAGTYTQAPIAGDTDSDNTFDGVEFTGVFDGNGHVIRNLTIDGMHYCGLFGKLDEGSEVKCLGLENMSIDPSGSYVGGLAGYSNYGIITNCYTGGLIKSGIYVGGLVGRAYYTEISNSYSVCTVNGYRYAGGLVGYSPQGNISSCFASGIVSCRYENWGGLVAHLDQGNINSSYFYVYGGPDNGFGVALDDEQLQDGANFVGFDFTGNASDGTDDHWTIESGYMPKLSWQAGSGFEAPYVLDTITTTLSGTGYEHDPFIIASNANLFEFKNNSTLRIGHYSLTNDIALSTLPDTQAFITEAFCGSFNGNGHAISNLTIDGGSYLGFFTSLRGSVESLTLEGVSIASITGGTIGSLAGFNYGVISNCNSAGMVRGGHSVGGLVGTNYGGIINSYSVCSVTGSNANDLGMVGGLVGINIGSITKSYSADEVVGGEKVGGLVGENRSMITNCYSTVAINGDLDSGGFVGVNKGSVINCYTTAFFNPIYAGEYPPYADNFGGFVGENIGSIDKVYFYVYWGGKDNGYGIGLYDAQFRDKSIFEGFDFADDVSDGTEDIWTIEPGYMPRLSWQESPGFEAPDLIDRITTSLSGTGYPDDPFIIASYDDLIEFGTNSDLRFGYYTLANDIDLSGVTYTEAFVPENFYGSFDGNGNTISNLTINGNDRLGFFKELHGSVGNLKLENISVAGSGDYIGGIVSSNRYGIVSGSFSSGMIEGVTYVGGLAGINNSSIGSSSSTCEVSGDIKIGGLTGYNNGSVEGCSSTGAVDGNNYMIGGLVGENRGDIIDSYTSGRVNGGHKVGGLVGINDGGNITSSYSSSEVTGGTKIGGLVGAINRSSNTINCYSLGTVSGDEYVGGLLGYSWYGLIRECYSTGKVNNTNDGDYVGGLIGYGALGVFERSFWDIQTSGMAVGYNQDTSYRPTIRYVYGKNTTDMQNLTTFADVDWDFDGVWDICDSYPRLQWERLAGDVVCPHGVDQDDLSVFMGCWLDVANADADINTDGIINLTDLADLAQSWMAYCVPSCEEDITGDNHIDQDDLYIMATQWLRTDECVGTDLNGDDFVNLEDMAIFSGNWLEGRVPMYGDINGDWRVDYVDVSRMAAGWLTTSGDAGWDADCDLYLDGVIDILDLVKLAGQWLEGAD